MAYSQREILQVFGNSVPDDFRKQLLRRLFGSYQAASSSLLGATPPGKA